MSLGFLQLRLQKQALIHMTRQVKPDPFGHWKSTSTVFDLKGMQQRSSVHTPQYLGRYVFVLVQPDMVKLCGLSTL